MKTRLLNSHPPSTSGFSSLLGHLILTDNITYTHPILVGKGSYGSVYKVNIDNPTLNHLSWGGKPIEWVVKKSTYQFPEEAKIQSRFYLTLKPQHIQDKYYTYSEFIPGVNLSQYHSQDFSEKLRILCQLAAQINQFHHFTRRGNPFVHGDLKANNIKVHIDPITHATNSYIYDFGYASVQKTDHPDQLFNFYHVATEAINKNYFPKETFDGVYCFKTDVYMFGTVILKFLGGKVPTHLTPLIPAINCYMRRVRDTEYANRPTSDELLKFLLTLNRLHLLKESQLEDQPLEFALMAKIIMISCGYWHWNCFVNKPKDGQAPVWENFDFEEHPEITQVIAILYAKGLLSIGMNSFLFANSHAAAAIITLYKEDCLNELTLTMLVHQPGLSKQMINLKRQEINTFFAERCASALNNQQLQTFFLTHINNTAVVKSLVTHETHRLTLPLLKQGFECLMAQKQPINVESLVKLPGNLKEKRVLAKNIVLYQFNQCQTTDAAMQVLQGLKQVDYLYKRQGFFKFFSLRNHQYQGEKVSGTWLEIVKMCTDRVKAIEAMPKPSQGLGMMTHRKWVTHT